MEAEKIDDDNNDINNNDNSKSNLLKKNEFLFSEKTQWKYKINCTKE